MVGVTNSVSGNQIPGGINTMPFPVVCRGCLFVTPHDKSGVIHGDDTPIVLLQFGDGINEDAGLLGNWSFGPFGKQMHGVVFGIHVNVFVLGCGSVVGVL